MLQETKILAQELQLGSSLNQSVQQTRRADFNLMLAMLTEDVREQSQFLLPKTAQEEKQLTNETWRKTFDLPKPQALSLASLEQISEFNQAGLVNEHRQTALRLKDCLKPLPLAFRNNTTHISTAVLSNTSIHCQDRSIGKEKHERVEMNANAWLKSLKDALTYQAIDSNELQYA